VSKDWAIPPIGAELAEHRDFQEAPEHAVHLAEENRLSGMVKDRFTRRWPGRASEFYLPSDNESS
jgi:hypothetical protein